MLNGSQQHRKKKLKAFDVRESKMEVTKDISKLMTIKLEKSTARTMGGLSANKVFGKMIAATIKQLPDNVKLFAKDEINVIFKCRMHSATIYFSTNYSVSILTSKYFSNSNINARPTGSCEPYQP